MKAVILAGGFGTRIAEETHLKPKPMIEIGGKPILWHILKIYSAYNINEFIICCGYKGYLIKEYFANYFLHNSDVTFDLTSNKTLIHQANSEPWKVTLVETGEKTQTAGRLLKVKKYLNNEPFAFTYGDGVSDINLNNLISQHNKSNKLVTLTAIKPPGRYGAIKLKGNSVVSFQEKPQGDQAWINGGFFMVDYSAIDFITDFDQSWEFDILPKIASNNNLSAYLHNGFWLPMDTLRDKQKLEKLWENNDAPWKKWK